jgi:hypothetical protein
MSLDSFILSVFNRCLPCSFWSFNHLQTECIYFKNYLISVLRFIIFFVSHNNLNAHFCNNNNILLREKKF